MRTNHHVDSCGIQLDVCGGTLLYTWWLVCIDISASHNKLHTKIHCIVVSLCLLVSCRYYICGYLPATALRNNRMSWNTVSWMRIHVSAGYNLDCWLWDPFFGAYCVLGLVYLLQLRLSTGLRMFNQKYLFHSRWTTGWTQNTYICELYLGYSPIFWVNCLVVLMHVFNMQLSAGLRTQNQEIALPAENQFDQEYMFRWVRTLIHVILA